MQKLLAGGFALAFLMPRLHAAQVPVVSASNVLVRVMAANISTGNNQRYNVVEGSAADREKGVKAWEEWWAKNKARFAATTSS